MSEKKASKDIGNIASGVAIAASILPLIEPAISVAHNYFDKAIEEQKKLVTVPALYDKEYPLTVDQAVELLESHGLKATLVKTSLSDASIEYRSCFDSQVIKTSPKANQKVDPGSVVLVKYISQDVIDKSQELFKKSEEYKEKILKEKNAKRATQKEKMNQLVSETVSGMMSEIQKVSSALQRRKNTKEK